MESDNNTEKIRTLGFYQPYGSLMIHGKKETRWVRIGKKPPFPLGKYLIYTTQNPATKEQLLDWSGALITGEIKMLLSDEETKGYNQYAIAIGELTGVSKLTINDEKTFVQYVGEKTELIEGVSVTKIQWGLQFENVQRIEPFKWNFGKQGVGFVPDSEINKIKLFAA